MTIQPEQVLSFIELDQIASLYGTLIDHQDWGRLGEVLSDDIVFDLTGIGRGVLEGLPEVQRYMEQDAIHPAAHLVANVVVQELDDNSGRMSCRLLAVQGDGSVVAGEYQDEVRRTAAGWRFSRRAFTYTRRSRTGAN
ncbi:MAG: nuclear transport factor 2 family protein [Microthrixaceae bacterium]